MSHRVTEQHQHAAQGPVNGVWSTALVAAAVTVAFTRVAWAFLVRASQLQRSGRLPVRQLAYVPVLATDRVHAAVYVGAGGGLADPTDGADVDDMGLLARAMEQSLRPASAPRVRARDVVVPVAGAPASEFPADLFEDPEEVDEPVRVLATLTAAVAVLAGVPAIVRPLEAWAPIAVAIAVVLGATAWWLSRRP